MHAFKLLALDIGGVLADINKTDIKIYLNNHNLNLSHIFNDTFIDLQKGLIEYEEFSDKICTQYLLDKQKFSFYFTRMIQAKPIAFQLQYLTLPYIFFSNINALHFKYFINLINVPKKISHSSIVSFKEKILKPDKQLFKELLKKTSFLAHEILIIDDKATVIEQALFYGFQGLHITHDQPLDLFFRKIKIQSR